MRTRRAPCPPPGSSGLRGHRREAEKPGRRPCSCGLGGRRRRPPVRRARYRAPRQRHYETERRPARGVSEERGTRRPRPNTKARRLGARAVVERPAPARPTRPGALRNKRQRRVGRLIARPAGPDGARRRRPRRRRNGLEHEGVFGDSRLGPREPHGSGERHKCSEGPALWRGKARRHPLQPQAAATSSFFSDLSYGGAKTRQTRARRRGGPRGRDDFQRRPQRAPPRGGGRRSG